MVLQRVAIHSEVGRTHKVNLLSLTHTGEVNSSKFHGNFSFVQQESSYRNTTKWSHILFLLVFEWVKHFCYYVLLMCYFVK